MIEITFNKDGLVPAIVQHADSGEVLMVGYMNQEALDRTLETKLVTFYSRSRGQLWQKGETSGNVLRLRRLVADCDADVLLAFAEPAGPTCHTGSRSCFFQPLVELSDEPIWSQTAQELFEVVSQRLRDRPEGSYVSSLADGGVDRIARKIGEEATEVVIAAKNEDREELTREMADLWFHSLILLASQGLSPRDVWAELHKRRR